MLIWLASYPRSGNTFVRVVLNDVFGIKTPSLWGDGDDRVFSARPGVVDAVGHEKRKGSPEELIEEARNSTTPIIVKTHEPPWTDDPAIYIVRDGRSATVSYYHYLTEVEKIATSYEAIIDGQVYAGSWSDHFLAWNPIKRPRTLLLRYEEMTSHIDGLIEKLQLFCSLAPKGTTPKSFHDLHRMHPEFFRRGDDSANVEEFKPYEEQFMARHGELMRQLNYVT